jgi:hypothetical protein
MQQLQLLQQWQHPWLLLLLRPVLQVHQWLLCWCELL